jgi:hypothetical protein
MLVWSEAALQRGGINAKELLVLSGTTPVVVSQPVESTAQAIKRYLDMYEQSKPTGRATKPRRQGSRFVS